MNKRINKLLLSVMLSALLIGLVSSVYGHTVPTGDAEAINSKMTLLKEKSTGSRYYIGNEPIKEAKK